MIILYFISFYCPAVQCERKPLVLDQKAIQQQLLPGNANNNEISNPSTNVLYNRNKTIGLDYQTSSGESGDEENNTARHQGGWGINGNPYASSLTNTNSRSSNENLIGGYPASKFTAVMIDRVDEEGGRALLHLSQSCKRR